MLLLAFAAEGAMVTTSNMNRRVKNAKKANSWQNRLDKALLDVDAGPQARIRLLQRALKDGALQDDVKLAVEEIKEKGMGKGHVLALDLLFPTGTTARADLESLVLLRKQVPELIAAQKQQPPPTRAQLQELLSSAPPPDPLVGFKIAGELAGLATDQAKRQAILDEAKNALRATPTGLEAPRYRVVRTWKGVELREYDAYSVATTDMSGVEGGGAGFQTLASYLFGGNVQGEAMAMTMPVEISSGAEGEGGAMSFVLPRANADAPPSPNTDDVRIEQVGARLVAVRAFGGIVTDEEVARQRASLLEAIAADGATAPLGAEEGGAISSSVLQYNAPYTLPWRRRNEMVIVVTAVEAAPVVSWYDSGLRL